MVNYPCTVCKGSGQTSEICDRCNGSGREQYSILGIWTMTKCCDACFSLAQDDATGKKRCRACRGTGSRLAGSE